MNPEERVAGGGGSTSRGQNPGPGGMNVKAMRRIV